MCTVSEVIACFPESHAAFILPVPYRAQLSVASHLDFPRIHFAGRYHADVNTVNNYIENLDPSHPKQNLTPGWNPSGGNEWSLTDCYVTSVVYQNGSSTNNTEHEPTIGASVVTNPGSVHGKLVSLDVEAQNKCALWGHNRNKVIATLCFCS